VRGPRLRHGSGRDLTPRRLPSGKSIGCRHLNARGEPVGFDARKAAKAHDPAVGFVAHYHDY
jgi:hypothetical protein